jgi:methionine synthase I (cobalamin-dependent)
MILQSGKVLMIYALRAYKQQVEALIDGGSDLLLVETILTR